MTKSKQARGSRCILARVHQANRVTILFDVDIVLPTSSMCNNSTKATDKGKQATDKGKHTTNHKVIMIGHLNVCSEDANASGVPKAFQMSMSCPDDRMDDAIFQG
eukprot:CAMPEP_0114266872 /NCGR_PEP_ID=MMETSP0058-20121206/24894_1 /TAXON_ID=36894 /ORGANISM="Pyramimonas parkeae, CCMP726" /LENGTH=104 /DNA_ID=CAMNT_0001384487 /DNA_START=109 /DNA_END=422 /DNA_ORIENTATION=+